jgi:hypothetical protein
MIVPLVVVAKFPAVIAVLLAGAIDAPSVVPDPDVIAKLPPILSGAVVAVS